MDPFQLRGDGEGMIEPPHQFAKSPPARLFLRYLTTLLLILSNTFQGCYTVTGGDLIGQRKVAGSERLKSWSYVIELPSRPTQAHPEAVFQIVRTPLYDVQYVNLHSAIYEANHGANFLLTLTGAGLVYGGLKTDTSSLALKILKASMLVGGTLAVIYGVEALLFSPREPFTSSRPVEGESNYKTEKGLAEPLKRKTVQVRIKGKTRAYTTNWEGKFSVDLVREYGLTAFKSAEQINILVNCSELSVSKNFVISSAEWTVPILRVEAQEGWVYESPSIFSRRIGQYKRGETLRIEELGDVQWVKIRTRNATGWIPKIAGSVVWVTENNLGDP